MEKDSAKHPYDIEAAVKWRREIEVENEFCFGDAAPPFPPLTLPFVSCYKTSKLFNLMIATEVALPSLRWILATSPAETQGRGTMTPHSSKQSILRPGTFQSTAK